jgi:hypothetical protein
MIAAPRLLLVTQRIISMSDVSRNKTSSLAFIDTIIADMEQKTEIKAQHLHFEMQMRFIKNLRAQLAKNSVIFDEADFSTELVELRRLHMQQRSTAQPGALAEPVSRHMLSLFRA